MSNTKEEKQAMNPYHYILKCIGGKWKMTILHEIDTFGSIRFNYAVRVFPLSEKVLSQQLKELIEDGLVQRNVDSSVYPPAVEYVLTDAGAELVPVLEPPGILLYSHRLQICFLQIPVLQLQRL